MSWKRVDFACACAQTNVILLPGKSSTVGGIPQLSSCLGYHGLAGQALKTRIVYAIFRVIRLLSSIIISCTLSARRW